MPAALTFDEVAVLRGFRLIDPMAQYQHNSWSPALHNAIRVASRDAGGDDQVHIERAIEGLARKKYLGSTGRGSQRQFWLAEKGAKALDALPTKEAS